MTKLYSLLSSSSANSYLYQFGNTKILVDIGASCKQICMKLNDIGINPNEIDAIFITHEHIDHVKGLKVFLNNHKIKLYISKKVYSLLDISYENVEFVSCNNIYYVNNVKIKCLNTSHDAVDSFFYVLDYRNKEYVHLLDTGYINYNLFEDLNNKYCYIIETNYDDKLIMTNEKYPFLTKKRIMSDLGHLSNFQARDYIKKLKGSKTKYILYGHVSENNNNSEKINSAFIEIDIENKILLKKDQTVEVVFYE